ncbi:hypothetical protein HYDPIDRAFT_24629 [Hydnomerulius pinastri MD-312]|nr:hypothetical protein HYDPIDRAFT_24629 [Hydnomerulius pinastri MD-312]
MSETRPNLSTSLSFSGAASSSRNLKRRLSSSGDLAFFTPAATSFNPKPYTPNGASTHILNAPKLPPPIRTHSAASLAQHIPVMDPSPSDPNVVFIHPPFVDFPDSHLYPEGLSYSLMAVNPEWFLVQSDFTSSVSNNPDAIPYPPQLEPPRGWCPAKKKDLKALGPDGWPEGEEPRLRCTFCRRTYAGVNAKSMWRRHVYEKHKIAMSNRRDGNDRTRGGRGSTREHRNAVSDKENLSDDHHRRRPSTENGSTKSKTRPFHASSEGSSRYLDEDQEENIPTPSAPSIEQTEFPMPTLPSREHSPADVNTECSGPDDNSQGNSEADGISLSPKAMRFTIPMSPYDPTLTPSFRHSPPRLPSDQPWRFPSPSHPLHSKAREFCLSMLVRDGVSPIIKGSSTTDSSSPSLGPPSIINTPCSAIGRSKTFSDAFGSSPVIFRPSPRQLFSDGQSPVPFNRLDFRKRVNDSPLSGSLRRRTHYHRPSTMNSSLDLHGDSLSDGSLSSASSMGINVAMGSPVHLSNEDPFGGLYKPSLEPTVHAEGVTQRTPPPPGSSPETDSPVVRNARYAGVGAPELEAGLVGLGIGLMAPFRLSTCRTQSDQVMDVSPEENDEDEVEKALTDSSPGFRSPTAILSSKHLRSPPLKRRRMTVD